MPREGRKLLQYRKGKKGFFWYTVRVALCCRINNPACLRDIIFSFPTRSLRFDQHSYMNGSRKLDILSVGFEFEAEDIQSLHLMIRQICSVQKPST